MAAPLAACSNNCCKPHQYRNLQSLLLFEQCRQIVWIAPASRYGIRAHRPKMPHSEFQLHENNEKCGNTTRNSHRSDLISFVIDIIDPIRKKWHTYSVNLYSFSQQNFSRRQFDWICWNRWTRWFILMLRDRTPVRGKLWSLLK